MKPSVRNIFTASARGIRPIQRPAASLIEALCCASAVVLWLLPASSAQAANVPWSGSISTGFEDGGNWTGNTAPANDLTTDVGVFGGAVTANQSSLTQSRSISGLSFTTSTGGWTLGSGSSADVLSTGGSGISSSGSSGANTISANVTLASASGTQTVSQSSGGTLLFTGNLAMSGSNQLKLGVSGSGTIIINPGASKSLNLSGSNAANRLFQFNGGTVVLGGDDATYGPRTQSVNTIANVVSPGTSATWQFNSSTTVLVNSGVWNFGDPTTSGATETITITGGLMQVTGMRNYAGSNDTITVTGSGAFVEGVGGAAAGYQPTANASRMAIGGSVGSGTHVVNLSQSGFIDLAQAMAANTVGSTMAANTAQALFNQTGGMLRVGVTNGGEGSYKDFTIGGAANTTGTNAFTLTSGTALFAGTVSGSTAGAGGVNNFNFLGGTLTAATLNATNLGYSTTATGTSDQTANSTNIGTLTNQGGTLAPGGVILSTSTDSYGTVTVTGSATTGKTAITGNYMQQSGGTLAISMNGTTASATFQDAVSSGKYSNVSVTGTLTLGGTLSISLINSFTPAAGNTFNIITGTTPTGSFTNVNPVNHRVNVAGGGSFIFTPGATSTLSGYSTGSVLTWTGSGGSAWDIATTPNFSNGSPSVYHNGDSVIFDDSAANKSVTLSTTVQPADVAVNTTGTYTLSGSGTIAGSAPLLKAGAGTWVLSTANTYTGGTNITGGILQLGNASALGTGPVTVNSSGTLDLNGYTISIPSATGSMTVNAGGIVTGAGAAEATVSTNAATSNVVNNGTMSGLITDAGSGPASPNQNVNASAVVATGQALLNAGSTTGAITNNGQLTLSGSTAITAIGTISGSGLNGGINDQNTASKTLTFADGSAFAYYVSSGTAGNTTPVVLQVAGNGTTSFQWFGYNNNKSAISGTFNGGTFNLNKAGQNNSNTDFLGTMNVANGSTVNIADARYFQGTWNVTHGTLAFGGDLANGHGGLATVLTVDNSGGGSGSLINALAHFTIASNTIVGASVANSLTVGSGGTATIANVVTLGNGRAQTSLVTNSLAVNGGLLAVTSNGLVLNNGVDPTNGSTTNAANQNNTFTVSSGTASISGSVTVGSNNAAASNTITDTVNLHGGKLLVSSTIQGGTGANQTNLFNWTGGQLTAATITPGAGFNGGGSIDSTTLTQSAGTLAPGDVNVSGKTTINGAYTLSGGSLAIDIGGTTQATAFQNGIAKYDTVAVTGAITLGGTLNISLINSFTPANGDTYTVISGSSVGGAFSNLSGGRIAAGAGSFLVTNTGNSITLSDYNSGATSGYASWAATNAPTGTAADDFDGDGVTNGVEYVLGGTKLTNDLGKLPKISTSGGDMVFTFYRAQASIDGTTTVNIQVGTTLASWPATYNVPATAVANNPGVTVLKDNPSAGTDKVTLTVIQAPDAKKFARLNVSVAP